MRNILISSGLAAAALAATSGSAQATIVDITVTGVVDATRLQNLDLVFGPNLAAGDAVSADFKVTTLGSPYVLNPTINVVSAGGPDGAVVGAGPISPVLSSAVSIDGYTFSVPSDFLSLVAYQFDPTNPAADVEVLATDGSSLSVQVGDAGGPTPPTSLSAAYAWSGLCTRCGTIEGPNGATFVAFDVTSFNATPEAGGAPEPAAWALMIAGFGLTGAALRRRAALAATAWLQASRP